ncbi:winged helix-turn-helix transcriptional regulator [Agromyces sp. NPDC057679]|uniref:winged helix-turn-helix transcriptional regulator n=1 Tax=Agromyces sp. NPDC057679 TaxID=3346207 RepID=UPI00366D5BA8
MRRDELGDSGCGIAQALGVLGDWRTILVLRELAGGVSRFDALQAELGLSRRALAELLHSLVADGVVERHPYSVHPPRVDYLLTRKGEAVVPALLALQDWGDRWVMGDGEGPTAEVAAHEHDRVAALVGERVPTVALPGTRGEVRLPAHDAWTVVFCFPGAFAPGDPGYPTGWDAVPGAAGCTLEAKAYERIAPALREAGAVVVGVSTQRADQQLRFAEHAGLGYPLAADPDGRLAVALRLPTFRVAGAERYKRQSLLVDPDGVVQAVQAPITDPAASAEQMLERVRELAALRPPRSA